MTKIFFDAEFTGLTKKSTLISIGLVSQSGRMFYAEFTDYDTSLVSDWIKDNVTSNLLYQHETNGVISLGNPVIVKGYSYEIKKHLLSWLAQFEDIEFWADCPAYDWVLLNDLIATYDDGYPSLPENVASYTPFDIATLLHKGGHGFDINREAFVGDEWDNFGITHGKHNALYDAVLCFACYRRL